MNAAFTDGHAKTYETRGIKAGWFKIGSAWRDDHNITAGNSQSLVQW